MIERYSSKEMGRIWSDTGKFKRFYEVEKASGQAMASRGFISKEILDRNLSNPPDFSEKDLQDIAAEETVLKHDVLAFLAFLQTRTAGDEFVLHRGMTSSDVVDSALAMQMRDSLELVETELESLIVSTRELSRAHLKTPCVGRSHGMRAEPMSFGVKVASWGSSLKRVRERIRAAKKSAKFGKISGAVGTFAHFDPEVERIALEALGLEPEPVSTQIVPRDRVADVVVALAFLGSSLESIALEIRHLSRSEVGEVSEPFGEKQKGSSAMPHKRNPMMCENVCGLARVLRSYVNPAFEDIALWHERDISHSSVERIILPDAFHLSHTLLKRMGNIVQNLSVYPEKMKENLYLKNGDVFSGSLLREALKAGIPREVAYKAIQGIAFKVRSSGMFFKDLVQTDEMLKELSSKAFDLEPHLANAQIIFDRVFQEPTA